MSARRMSLGGPRSTILRDASSKQNTRSSSASRNRMSIGGKAVDSSDSYQSENASEQSYALLSEWRKQTRSKENAIAVNAEGHAIPPKRTRMNDSQPPLPSSSRGGFVESGESALEGYRRRKLLLRQQQSTIDSSFEDNDDTFHGTRGMSLLSSTPSHGKKLGSGARRLSGIGMTQRLQNHYSLSQDSDTSSYYSAANYSQHTINLSQLSIDQDTEALARGVNTVEDAGLRSQIREMQQRIEKLEKEKMELKMAIAPLEARFRNKEDSWIKEQSRLIDEIESLKEERQKANEKNRDLEMFYERIQEECKQLKLEIKKASSTLNTTTDNSAWGRQLQNDRDVAEYKEKFHSAKEEINSLLLDNVSIEKELHATKIELESLYSRYDELKGEFEEVSKTTSASQEAEIKLEHLTTEHIATSAQLNAVCADLAATKARAEATVEALEDQHKKEVEQLQFELCVLKTRTANSNTNKGSMNGHNADLEDIAVLKAHIEDRDRRLAELEKKILEGETLRRQMHNRIQELRGNIRVFVRTRPFLPNDGQCEQTAIDVMPDGESLSIIDTRNTESHNFKFDKVFPPSAGQDQVFQEVADFVQSALDGYRVCLFSYGQTGSGKTHTMQGSGNGVMRGIIPRAVEQILSQAKSMQSHRWKISLRASFLEIYNETLKDLLLGTSRDKTLVKDPPKLSIKRNREGNSYVEGLTEVKIETDNSGEGLRQLDELMDIAARARSVARTNMNSQSSRSHSVFMLHLNGFNEENGAEVSGLLNLCDLAGSERLDRSGAGADAQRLRETQAINKSLSCLGDVFNALAQGASHVPYRNSKLTYLLQDCLSGDGKALMFVNLSPTTTSSNESLCSLRFAQRVNQVELGKATKHVSYKH